MGKASARAPCRGTRPQIARELERLEGKLMREAGIKPEG